MSGCTLWAGVLSNDYGSFKNRPAHRIAWFIATGEWPLGKWLCHTCNNSACVNVRHLYVGDSKTNSRDLARSGHQFWRIRGGDLHPSLNAMRALEKRSAFSTP